MKLLTLLLIPLSLYGSAPKKYTPQELKALKPPLAAQQYSLHYKITAKAVARVAPHVAATMPFSPRPVRNRLKRYVNAPAPKNTPERKPVAARDIPFPEIILSFEAVK